jgi:hypothetical protein
MSSPVSSSAIMTSGRVGHLSVGRRSAHRQKYPGAAGSGSSTPGGTNRTKQTQFARRRQECVRTSRAGKGPRPLPILRNKPNFPPSNSEGKHLVEKELRRVRPARRLGKTKPISERTAIDRGRQGSPSRPGDLNVRNKPNSPATDRDASGPAEPGKAPCRCQFCETNPMSPWAIWRASTFCRKSYDPLGLQEAPEKRSQFPNGRPSTGAGKALRPARGGLERAKQTQFAQRRLERVRTGGSGKSPPPAPIVRNKTNSPRAVRAPLLYPPACSLPCGRREIIRMTPSDRLEAELPAAQDEADTGLGRGGKAIWLQW